MNTVELVAGMMKQNYDAVGFIPTTRIELYERSGQIILQNDLRGRAAGYLIYGTALPGKPLSVYQTCIDHDRRLLGFGETAVHALIERATVRNCSAIKLRCADDLAANAFWLSLGFEHTNTLHPGNKRNRAINVYVLQLWPMLFEVQS